MLKLLANFRFQIGIGAFSSLDEKKKGAFRIRGGAILILGPYGRGHIRNSSFGGVHIQNSSYGGVHIGKIRQYAGWQLNSISNMPGD